MIFWVQNNSITDPCLNLALEEFCLRKLAPDRSLLLTYVNKPSVIVGRNQNILAEVNIPFAAQQGFHVVRRISGGGAVYHDLGNLNFSFIQAHNRRSFKTIRHTLKPVRLTLLKAGVTAEFNARNDLFVAGKKVSGNAQFSNTRRDIVHGTLLFESDLDALRRSLASTVELISSRALKSIPSAVTNIADFLPRRIGLDDFRQMLLHTIGEKNGGFREMTVSDRHWQDISRLADEKYRSWQWNFGKAPAFRIRRSAQTPVGYLEAAIAVEGGRITGILIGGTIADVNRLATLDKVLKGVPFHRETIQNRLSDLDLRSFGLTLTASQIAAYFCGQGISGLAPGLQNA